MSPTAQQSGFLEARLELRVKTKKGIMCVLVLVLT